MPDVDRLMRDLARLASFGARDAGGIDRPAFSPALMAAGRWLAGRMDEAGLASRVDAAGNVIGRLGPARGPALVCGSHIDTVPGGGAYDGALGVLAGLECARTLADAAGDLRIALEVVAFSDEEGAYVGMLGSRAMTGRLSPDEVRHAIGRRGDGLGEAMLRAGLDAAELHRAARPVQDLAGYLELHVEQGPVLADGDLDIGVVESIVGTEVVEYTLHGQARHAGTTPMHARRDAGRAACEGVADAFRAGEDLGPDHRMTFGAVEFDPGASNVVPGRARVVSEARAADARGLARARRAVDAAFERSASRNGVVLTTRHLGTDPACRMSPTVTGLIARACASSRRNFTTLSSGAGHDACNFADLVPTGMIFIPSRGGVSHHPDEHSDQAWIAAGTEVLLDVIGGIVL